jgi:hypothetical protein
MNYLLIILILISFYLFISYFSYNTENFISLRPWKKYKEIKNVAQNYPLNNNDINNNNNNNNDIENSVNNNLIDDDENEIDYYEIIDKGFLNDYELLDKNKKNVCNIQGYIDFDKFNLNFKCNNKDIKINLIKDFNDYFTFNFDSNSYKIMLQNGLKITKNEFENYNIQILDNRINFDDSGYSIGYIQNNLIYNNTNINENYFIMFIFYILYKEIMENKKNYDKIYNSNNSDNDDDD